MVNVGKQLRMGKIFREDGRTLIVAMDHGLFGPMPGLECPAETIKKVVAGCPDAIMTNQGIIAQFAKELSALPSVIWTIPADATGVSYVAKAVKLGVDAVKIGVFAPFAQREKYEAFGPIAAACEEWGMPCFVEPVPTTDKGEVLHDVKSVKIAARMGAEIGGDFLKVAYTGSSKTFKEVVDTCPAPVTIMGGPKMESDRDVLETVKGMVEAGGAGVAFGRNLWQHKDPTAMVRAIRKILHEDASVDAALKELK